jgi:serine phosphatase RsbU (regulator of sigma subunit)
MWFSLFLNNDSHCQSIETGRPLMKIFTNKDYNSSRINWCVIQDNRGLIYVGNENGILEFDGNSWRKIEVPNSEIVRSMDVADDGTIYLCAGYDFGYLEPNSTGLLEFKSLLPFLDKKHHNFGEMWDVATSSHGIYFKNSDKVFRWNGNDFMVWDSVYAFRLYNINDTIYSRNQDTGLMMVDGDSIKLMPNGEFFANIGVYNMLPFKKKGENSKILITTNRDGLFLHDGNKFNVFKTEIDDFLTENQVYNAYITSDDKIAISTQRGGVAIIDKLGTLHNKMNKSNGLPTDVIYDIWSDQRGGLWMASNNGVIYAEIPSSFSVLDKYILQEDESNSVIRFNGNFYVANSIGILYTSEKTNSFELLKESKNQAISFLEANGVLLAVTNDGIATIKDDEIIDKNYVNVYTLYKSKYFKDRIYAGSNYGFLILEKGDDGLFTEKYSKDLFNLVTNFAEDSNGNLWINGLFRGIYQVSGNLDELGTGVDSNVVYEYLTVKEGLPELKDDLFNIQDKVFLSTAKGMFSYSDSLKRFVRDSSFGIIFSDSTNSLSILGSSGNNTLWMLRDSVGNKEFGKATLKPDGKYSWEVNPEFMRLDSKSINSVYQDFDKLTNEEILWVVSEESLFRYKENKFKDLQSDFNTLIRKVIVNNDSLVYGGAPLGINLKDNFEFTYNQNNISFEFSSTSFEKPEANTFRYILNGNDKEWSDWTEETKKYYTNLASGDYSFHVIAKNVYGKISNPAIINFHVLSPWYYSWWAYLIYAFIFGTGVFIVDGIQRKRLLKKAKEKMKMQDAEHRALTAELQAKAAEAQSMIIQAENERKSKELEEARELQLSLLPKDLPNVENLNIEVYMKTATEVGGDYYDFSFTEDGTLNVAIGDATGHGMQAGTLVTIIKGLFISEAGNRGILEFFNDVSRTIKEIKLGRLMMAFSLLKINENRLQFSSAAMPPMYIYRKNSHSIDEIDMQGMPLGAMRNFKYNLYKTELNAGDCILLLSDGYPELANSNDEQIGYKRLQNQFLEIADRTPKEMIEYFKKSGSDWVDRKDPDDDVTFVVIKIK